jgi:5-formyltetrahydrofolate cyclo-ligase
LITPISLDDAKRAARSQALAARQGCDPAWGCLLSDHLMAAMPHAPGAVVSGFWPMEGEIDIRPVLERLHADGRVIVLPETPKRGNPLIFRQWRPGEVMIRERFGTYRPDGVVQDPDYLLVPLLAFDRRGHRLGYGGGFYDRTLARLPHATAIGCAFAAQELDVVPAGEYDARLHAVATEAGVHIFERP